MNISNGYDTLIVVHNQILILHILSLISLTSYSSSYSYSHYSSMANLLFMLINTAVLAVGIIVVGD